MNETNKAGAAGKITTAPQQITLYGRNDLYLAHVSVCRNSGLTDDVIIVFAEKAIDTAGVDYEALEKKGKALPFPNVEDILDVGTDVIIIGKVQTMRNAAQGIVDTYIYCDYIGIGYAEPQNDVYFVGTVEREPKNRHTPKGRNITDLIIRVPSEFASSFYCKVPVVLWGKIADEAAALTVGESVEIYGRLQSRTYTKRYEDGDAEEKTATEISASNFAIYRKK